MRDLLAKRNYFLAGLLVLLLSFTLAACDATGNGNATIDNTDAGTETVADTPEPTTEDSDVAETPAATADNGDLADTPEATTENGDLADTPEATTENGDLADTPEATETTTSTTGTDGLQTSPLATPTTGVGGTAGADCVEVDPHPIGETIAQDFDTSYDEVMGWFCEGYSFEDILLALQTAELTGRPAEELLATTDATTWPQIWQDSGLAAGMIGLAEGEFEVRGTIIALDEQAGSFDVQISAAGSVTGTTSSDDSEMAGSTGMDADPGNEGIDFSGTPTATNGSDVGAGDEITSTNDTGIDAGDEMTDTTEGIDFAGTPTATNGSDMDAGLTGSTMAAEQIYTIHVPEDQAFDDYALGDLVEIEIEPVLETGLVDGDDETGQEPLAGTPEATSTPTTGGLDSSTPEATGTPTTGGLDSSTPEATGTPGATDGDQDQDSDLAGQAPGQAMDVPEFELLGTVEAVDEAAGSIDIRVLDAAGNGETWTFFPSRQDVLGYYAEGDTVEIEIDLEARSDELDASDLDADSGDLDAATDATGTPTATTGSDIDATGTPTATTATDGDEDLSIHWDEDAFVLIGRVVTVDTAARSLDVQAMNETGEMQTYVFVMGQAQGFDEIEQGDIVRVLGSREGTNLVASQIDVTYDSWDSTGEQDADADQEQDSGALATGLARGEFEVRGTIVALDQLARSFDVEVSGATGTDTQDMDAGPALTATGDVTGTEAITSTDEMTGTDTTDTDTTLDTTEAPARIYTIHVPEDGSFEGYALGDVIEIEIEPALEASLADGDAETGQEPLTGTPEAPGTPEATGTPTTAGPDTGTPIAQITPMATPEATGGDQDQESDESSEFFAQTTGQPEFELLGTVEAVDQTAGSIEIMVQDAAAGSETWVFYPGGQNVLSEYAVGDTVEIEIDLELVALDLAASGSEADASDMAEATATTTTTTGTDLDATETPTITTGTDMDATETPTATTDADLDASTGDMVGQDRAADLGVCLRSAGQHPLPAAIAETYSTDYAQIQAWYCDDNVGLGEIMLALTTARASGEDAGDLIDRRIDDEDWAQIWQDLGLIDRVHDAGEPDTSLQDDGS